MFFTVTLIVIASASVFVPIGASPGKSEPSFQDLGDLPGGRFHSSFARSEMTPEWDMVWNCYDDPNLYNCGTDGTALTTDMEIDSQGNMYVTGLSSGSLDTCAPFYATVKYDKYGEFQWSAVFDPVEGCGEDPLDGNGGRITGPLTTWPALALYESEDPSQNALYMIGEHREFPPIRYTRYAVVKYDVENGTEVWRQYYVEEDLPGEFHRGWAQAVTVDSEGHIYVTGSVNLVTPQECGAMRIYTLKLEPNEGDIVEYHLSDDKFDDGLQFGNDVMSANGQPPVILVSPDDQYVYLTGTVKKLDDECDPVSSSLDFYVAKYWASNLTWIWEALYDRTGDSEEHLHDKVSGLALDSQGNAIVTGSFKYPPYTHHYVTVKFAANTGDFCWDSPPQGDNDDYFGYCWPSARAIAIDQDDNIYVTGAMYDGHNHVYGTLKLDSNGVVQREAYYEGFGDDGANEIGANDIAIDQAGNIYVTGESKGTSDDTDCVTVKYNSELEEQWTARYNRIGDGTGEEASQRGRDIQVDQSGNIYVSGRSWPNKRGYYYYYDYLLLKYNQSSQCVGDIDGDGCTGHSDLGILLGAWGSQPGDPNWNSDADLDDSGDVGHSDLGILLGDWGCGCVA